MELGLVGLGRMGGNMRERLRRAGHTVVGYARNPQVRDVASLEEMVNKLTMPRAVWVMVPHGDPTHEVITSLAELLSDRERREEPSLRSRRQPRPVAPGSAARDPRGVRRSHSRRA